MKSFRQLSAIALCSLFAAGVSVTVAQADDPKPCVAKSFKFKQVKAACSSGGQKKAKKSMSVAVKKMKAAGEDVKCTTCHPSTKKFFPLKSGSEKIGKFL